MDLFGSPFIFSLIIIIVLLGVLYSYFNYKLSEQDHKISSMFGLVKSMADEMQFIRRTKGNNLGETINLEYATQLLPEEDVNEELISVSDTEKYDDENLDVDDDSEIEEDSDFEEGDVEEDEELDIDELREDMKTIHLEEPIDLDTDFEPLDLNFTQIEESKEKEQEELKEQEDLDIDVVDPNKINLTKSDNYKKMSLNKLREVVVEKGLVADASKFKKNDILKLLGEE